MITTEDPIEEIKFCMASADQLQAEAEKLLREADYFRWRAARLICERLAAGMTQRVLAREIHRSQSLVSFVATTWRRFGDGSDYPGNQRPRFQDAYRHVQTRRPQVLDRLVPSATDSDDRREAKITMLNVLWMDSPFWVKLWADLNDESVAPEIRKALAEAVRLICRAMGLAGTDRERRLIEIEAIEAQMKANWEKCRAALNLDGREKRICKHGMEFTIPCGTDWPQHHKDHAELVEHIAAAGGHITKQPTSEI